MNKILSIDGGGIKGVFAASFLNQVEKKNNCRISDYFDIIAGTSTGGIIAAALSIGIPAQEILNLYLKNAKKIFGGSKFFKLVNTKYSSIGLEQVLREVFEDKKISDSQTRLLIPAYDLENRKVRVFKTPHSSDLYFDKDLAIVDCILATTAAPLYFSPHKMKGGVYIDGGVGANNPSLIALVEGMTRCGWEYQDIKMLSIGGVSGENFTTGNENMGLLNALKIQKCFMTAESQYSENICKLFLGKNYIRINQSSSRGQVSLDKVSKESLRTLENWGIMQAQNNMHIIENNFFNEKKAECKFCNIN